MTVIVFRPKIVALYIFVSNCATNFCNLRPQKVCYLKILLTKDSHPTLNFSTLVLFFAVNH